MNINNKPFYCYNPIQKDFIINMGLRWIDKGTHLKTNRNYWIFERGNKLDKILTKWKVFQQMRFEN